ncbi:MAG: hypothetical protein M1828_004363 [Chrysothrix sp. TS-e1954]|nr:MAG: hypothetical protein M1828_004363 [Chrysothrix sp. TS-e1954]
MSLSGSTSESEPSSPWTRNDDLGWPPVLARWTSHVQDIDVVIRPRYATRTELSYYRLLLDIESEFKKVPAVMMDDASLQGAYLYAHWQWPKGSDRMTMIDQGNVIETLQLLVRDGSQSALTLATASAARQYGLQAVPHLRPIETAVRWWEDHWWVRDNLSQFKSPTQLDGQALPIQATVNLPKSLSLLHGRSPLRNSEITDEETGNSNRKPSRRLEGSS